MKIFSTFLTRFLLTNIIILFGSSAHFPTPKVLAHELKAEGTISALIHINPDEKPVAGQPSEILFLINDTEKRFKAEDCNCTASVIDNGETVFSSPLATGKTSYRGIFAPAIPYTFPHKGTYTVKLTGEPKSMDGFKNFSISYDIKIERDISSPPAPSPNIALYSIVIFLIFVGVIYFIKLFFTKNNTNPQTT